MKEEVKYSIVIPVFNSSDILPDLVKDICLNLNSLDSQFEIILIDDCSSDSSWNTMKQLKQNYSEIRMFRLGNNFGQFATTSCGIENAKADIVITMDDDFQHPPSELLKMISHFEQSEKILIYGATKHKKRSTKSTIYSYVMTLLIYLTVFKHYVPKGFYYTGFRIFNKNIMWSDRLNTVGQHFDIYSLWHLHPKYIGFLDVKYQPRKKGVSGQTFRKKSSDAVLNLMCVFQSPLNLMYNLFFIFLLFGVGLITAYAFSINLVIPDNLFSGIIVLLLAILSLNLYIIGLYIGKSFALKRGQKDYHIIEKVD